MSRGQARAYLLLVFLALVADIAGRAFGGSRFAATRAKKRFAQFCVEMQKLGTAANSGNTGK